MERVDKLSILIVDDHLLIRLGLRHVLAQELRNVAFGEAQNVAEALAQLSAQPWHLVILDVSLSTPDDGFQVLGELTARLPQPAVLVLGAHPDLPSASRSFQLGATGYISKNAGRTDLLTAVSTVLKGKPHFSEAARKGVLRPASPSLHHELSTQEYKVLLALAAGRRIGEVAGELNLSPKTASSYKRRILNKLHVKSTADLVHYVIDHKLPQ